MNSGPSSRSRLRGPARVLAALLACGGIASAHAASTPVRLTDGEHSIERLLHIPVDVPPGRYTVQCEAFVDKPGRARAFNCYSREGVPLSLESAVIKVGGRASFILATRDEVPVAVSMLIMVRIDVTAGGPLVLVVPNNGIEASRYGLFYTASQRFKGFNTANPCRWSTLSRSISRPIEAQIGR